MKTEPLSSQRKPFHVTGRASNYKGRQKDPELGGRTTEEYEAVVARLCPVEYGEVMYDVLGAK